MAIALSLLIIYVLTGLLVALLILIDHYRETRQVMSYRAYRLTVLTWPAWLMLVLLVPRRTH